MIKKQATVQDANKKIISFLISCIAEFSKELKISITQASNYLIEYKGLDFLISHYQAQHLLSIEDSIQDLIVVCKKNGGGLE